MKMDYIAIIKHENDNYVGRFLEFDSYEIIQNDFEDLLTNLEKLLHSYICKIIKNNSEFPKFANFKNLKQESLKCAENEIAIIIQIDY